MDINHIQQLINRFKDGQCTLEEEQTLHSYFTSKPANSILAEWETYVAYFKNIETVRAIEIPEDAEKQMTFLEEETSPTSTPIKKINWVNDLWIVVAASVVGGLLFTMNIVNEKTKPLSSQSSNQTIIVNYTEEEVKEAYNEVKHIMLFVSEKLNRGKKPLEEIKRIETINNKIKQRKYETL